LESEEFNPLVMKSIIERLEWENNKYKKDVETLQDEKDIIKEKNNELSLNNEQLMEKIKKTLSEKYNLLQNLYNSENNIQSVPNDDISPCIELQTKIKKRDDKIKILKNENEMLSVEILKSKDLRNTVDEMKEKLLYTEHLEEKMKSLQNKITEIHGLKNKIRELEVDNENLKLNNEKLTKNNERIIPSLRNKLKESKSQNLALKQENYKFGTELDGLKNEMLESKKEILKLREEKEILATKFSKLQNEAFQEQLNVSNNYSPEPQPLSKLLLTPESRDKLYNLQEKMVLLQEDNDNNFIEVEDLKEKILETSQLKEYYEKNFEQYKSQLSKVSNNYATADSELKKDQNAIN